MVQLGDSGGGLVLQVEWDIDADHAAGQYFPDWIPGMQDQIARTFTIAGYTIKLANYYPAYTFAQFNAANDRTQRRYFVADGGEDEDFPTALQTSLDMIERQVNNFRSYTAEGDRHCILKHATFYSHTTEDVALRDWVADMAAHKEVKTVRCAAC